MDAVEYDLMDTAETSMWWYRALHANVLAAIQRHRPAAGGRLLDAGCGTGGVLARLGSRFPDLRLVGVDVNPAAARRAADKSGAPTVAGSVNALPFAAGSFSAMLSLDVLYHRAVELPAALADARRCLEPGGLFVVNVPAFRWMMSDHDRRVHTARRFDRAELRTLLEASGFRLLALGYWNSLLFPLMVARRKLFRPKDGASDVQTYPPMVDRLFGAVMAVERGLAGIGIRLPFGGSILAVAVRADG